MLSFYIALCSPNLTFAFHLLSLHSIYKYSTSTLGQVPVDGYSGHDTRAPPCSTLRPISCSGDGLTGSSCLHLEGVWDYIALRICLPTSFWLVVVLLHQHFLIQATVRACALCSGFFYLQSKIAVTEKKLS